MKKPTSKANSFNDLRFGIEDLFEALSDAVAEVSARIKEGETEEFRKNFDFMTDKGAIKAEAGFRMRVAGLEPISQSTSPAPSTKKDTRKPTKTSEKSAYQKLDYSLVQDDSSWLLTADMPGVAKKELVLKVIGSELKLRTNGQRRYTALVSMPEGARLEQIACTLKNGILELAYSASEPSS